MTEVNELSGLFVEIDNFDQIEEEDVDDLFDENDDENGPFRFELVQSIQPEEKVICKIYNPELLEKDQNEGSNDKKDQCWYKQLQLMREVIFLKELNHPTIVGFKGFNLYNNKIKFDDENEEEEDDDEPNDEKEYTNPTVFLEFLQNKSLQNVIDKKIKLPAVKRQICMIGLAAAVQYIHKKNIIHRNLNPKAIWLDENYYPKIFDFSKSRECHQDDTNKTSLGADAFYYQSSELFDPSFTSYSDSIDVYSLGRLMYYFITGMEPFKNKKDPNSAKGQYKLQEEIIKNKLMPILPDNISPQLKSLLERCWDINPQLRPTAAEIYYHLTQEREYLISEIDLQKDLPEIERYIDMIEDFESKNNAQKLDVQESLCFESYGTTSEPISSDIIPAEPAKQQQKLANIISTNFAVSIEKEVIPLLFAMAENGSLYEEDYLPQIMNLINDLCSKGNADAEKFMKEVFGDYIVGKNITEIKMNSVSNNAEKVNIPPWVTKIGKHAFSGFSNLLRVNVPNSVKIIDEEAFSACPKLRYVNLPESLEKESIGSGAFKGCVSLRYVKIPSKITVINDYTFTNNQELTTVILNHGLKTIGKSAFDSCKKLRSIELPKTVKVVSAKAFHDCDNLKTIYLRGQKNKVKFERKAYKFGVDRVELS